MSPLPEGSSPDQQLEQFEPAFREAPEQKIAAAPNGLVPANLLPSAADVLAQIFGPAQSLPAAVPPSDRYASLESQPHIRPGDTETEQPAPDRLAGLSEARHSTSLNEAVIEEEPAPRSELTSEPLDRPAAPPAVRAEHPLAASDAPAETQPDIAPESLSNESRPARKGVTPFARIAVSIRNFLVGGRQVKRKIALEEDSSSIETAQPGILQSGEISLEHAAVSATPERTAEATPSAMPHEQSEGQDNAALRTGRTPHAAASGADVQILPLEPEDSSQSLWLESSANDADQPQAPSHAHGWSGYPADAPIDSSVDASLNAHSDAPANDRINDQMNDRSHAQPSDRAAHQAADHTHSHSPSQDSPQHLAKSSGDTYNELVDLVEEDQAIASAIDRYANRANPAGVDDSSLAPEPQPEVAGSSSPHEEVDINAVLGIPRDSDRVVEQAFPQPQPPASSHAPIHLGVPVLAAAPSAKDQPADAEIPLLAPSLANVLAHELPESAANGHPSAIPYRDWSFEEKLACHHEWIESKGTLGKKADLTGIDLEGSDLIGVDLRFVDLHDGNLRAADLLMSDLRDACLVRANFRDSCLVGANLEAANLEGASLDTAMGLVPRQLAGANLHEASLPQSVLQFEALGEFKMASKKVQAFFVAMMAASAVSALLICMTKDFQLLTNSAVLFFLHSSTAAAALPTVQFYLAAPVALFILYLVFQFHLQHLWDLVLELPAVFPDGRTLGENEPRIVVGLLRSHFRWMNSDAPSTRLVEKVISGFLAYWIVPLTLLFYWARFLTLQEFRGTVLQELLVVAAVGVALYSSTKVGRPAETWLLQENIVERFVGRLKRIDAVKTALILLAVLTFLAAGTMMGVPHGKERAPQFMSGSLRRWAPSVLWTFGIDPYADLTEAVISIRPPNWTGADDQVSAVKGARLNNANFRYAQAYRVFLANAHLLHSNFQGAFLSQADLRNSDMGQSNLKYAILDQAMMNHVNLDRAVLDGASLSRADLRAANLSYASLANASLVDTHLEGATLYGARLVSATLIRTDFEKADLRESHLENANLEHADMRGAYLWSAKLMGARLTNAQLGSAIFVDADLRNADLRWAHLSGTVLTGADLTGANLDGADFRGAEGFGANQICSAKSRRGLLLDDAWKSQVSAQCGAGN